jgi:hypothetical protein
MTDDHGNPVLGGPVEPVVSDQALHALATRVGALHDDFARQDFVFRVRVGHEIVSTLYAGQFELYHLNQRNKRGSLARFIELHGADLQARGLGGTALRRCIRAAEVTPDPTQLPEFVTFSHVLEIATLPESERDGWLARLALEPMSVRELRAQIDASAPEPGAGSDPDPQTPKGRAGHVPRRLQSVADALADIPIDLASDVVDRPEVAAEAVQKLLNLRDQINVWLAQLGVGVDPG